MVSEFGRSSTDDHLRYAGSRNLVSSLYLCPADGAGQGGAPAARPPLRASDGMASSADWHPLAACFGIPPSRLPVGARHGLASAAARPSLADCRRTPCAAARPLARLHHGRAGGAASPPVEASGSQLSDAPASAASPQLVACNGTPQLVACHGTPPSVACHGTPPPVECHGTPPLVASLGTPPLVACHGTPLLVAYHGILADSE